MNDNGYGLWFLVVFNSALFILFAVSFFRMEEIGIIIKRDAKRLAGVS